MTPTAMISRRHALRLVTFGGVTVTLSACQMNTDMLAAGIGGAGSEANWLELGQEFDGGLMQIASQTDKLIDIQADYAAVLNLKDLEAKLRAEANNLRNGDSFGASSLKTANRLSKDAEKAIIAEVGKANNLSTQQQNVLSNGQKQHERAIEQMWVGVVRIGKVLIDARSAKKPSLGDLELVKVASNITTTAPRAMEFGNTSRATYSAYNEAFGYKGVYVPPRDKINNLPSV